jgi:glycosyltransferase involved in cell wall biosynthesis
LTLHQVLASPLIGGAGVVAVRLAAAARDRHIPCVSWVPGIGPASDSLEREHVGWRTYDLDHMKGRALPHLVACGRMWGGLARFTIERPLVHVHNPVVYRLVRPALAAARAKTVVHFQIEPTEEEIQWALAFPPRHVIACARYIAEKIERVLGQGGVTTPVSAIPNAIDLTRFTPEPAATARKRVGIRTNRMVVLQLANLAPHKGQTTIIRAIQLLKARGVDAECWFAGEDRTGSGRYEAELRTLCAELDVADIIRFLGFRDDGPDLLRAADVVVLPSSHEGLPLSVLEAHACGVPVIASPIPGVLEVVADGRTGFIVPPEQHQLYADRIQLLVERPDIKKEVVDAAAAQVAAQYGWPEFERRVFTIYDSLGLARQTVRATRAL